MAGRRHIAALVTIGALGVLTSRAVAQPARDADSLRAERAERVRAASDSLGAIGLGSVTVRASSIVAATASAAQPTSILGRETIAAAHARDASDVVALAPGAFVRKYGGEGGLRTLSLRGTSSQQTVVLVDGVRYQSSAAGGIDLGTIPASVLRSVEVVRGGNAARFGANALGGAVNLVTAPRLDGGSLLTASASAGSFGERTGAVTAATSIGTHALDATVTLASSDGDYPFLYREYGEQRTVRRENADARSLFARAAWSAPLGSANDMGLGLSLTGFESRRGVPGAIVQGSREQPHARIEERELFTVARGTHEGELWSILAAATNRINDLSYRDPDARLFGPEGIDNRYSRLESSLLVRARRIVDASGTLEGSVELSHARLEGNNLDPEAAGVVERLQGSAALSASRVFDELIDGTPIIVDGAVRLDAFSDVGLSASPSLGIVVRPMNGALRLRGHGSFNERVPSFTEQYYLNYGNVDLRPERSRSLDAGATVELLPTLLLEAGGFIIDTRDQIASVPRSPVLWSAENIARTLARGIELGLAGTALDGHLALNIAYTRMRAEDRTPGPTDGRLLMYAPEEILSSLAELRFDGVHVGATWQQVSHRHTTASNAAEAALAGYGILGAHVSVLARIGSIDVDARVEATNILDAQYQVVRNYPMPGRALRIGLTISHTTPVGVTP